MADEVRKVGDYLLRGVSILGATGVLLGGIVLLSKPENLLEDSAVWQIPVIGQPLKSFWEWPWQIGKLKITNQRLVGFGLTIIGINYFKIPHAVAWTLGQIPGMERPAQVGLAGYLSVFEFIENMFIPRLTAPDAIYRSKKWQKEYRDFYDGWSERMKDAKRITSDSGITDGIFIPSKPRGA